MTADEFVPGTIPLKKRISLDMEEISGIGRKFSAGGKNPLAFLDQQGTLFPRGFRRSFPHLKLRLPRFTHGEGIQAFHQNIMGSIRSVDGKFLLMIYLADPQKNGAGDQMDNHAVITFARQLDQIDLSVMIQTDIVLTAEMDFRPPFLGTQFGSFDEREIDRPLLVFGIRGGLHENVSDDMAQPSIAMTVIFVFLCRKDQERQGRQKNRHYDCLFHLSSSSTTF